MNVNAKFNQLSHNIAQVKSLRIQIKVWEDGVRDSVWSILGKDPTIESAEAMLNYLSGQGYDGPELLYIMRQIEELKQSTH